MTKKPTASPDDNIQTRDNIDRREFIRKTIKGLKGFAIIGLIASAYPHEAFSIDTLCNTHCTGSYYYNDDNCSKTGDKDNNCGFLDESTEEYDPDNDCSLGEIVGGIQQQASTDNNCGASFKDDTLDKDESCGLSHAGGYSEVDESCGYILDDTDENCGHRYASWHWFKDTDNATSTSQ